MYESSHHHDHQTNEVVLILFNNFFNWFDTRKLKLNKWKKNYNQFQEKINYYCYWVLRYFSHVWIAPTTQFDLWILKNTFDFSVKFKLSEMNIGKLNFVATRKNKACQILRKNTTKINAMQLLCCFFYFSNSSKPI